jgi:hypothetical protein
MSQKKFKKGRFLYEQSITPPSNWKKNGNAFERFNIISKNDKLRTFLSYFWHWYTSKT